MASLPREDVTQLLLAWRQGVNSDLWQKIDEIYHAALQYKPDERKAFVDEAYRGDDEFRRELESPLVEDKTAPVKDLLLVTL